MDAPTHTIIQSPIGKIAIHAEAEHITKLEFLPESTPLKPSSHPLCQKATQQITHYFNNPKALFNLPLRFTGTPFQQRIWHYLASMNRNTAITYGELATLLRTSPRAIGNACKCNPIPLIIPCHLVVGKTHIGGFMGATNGSPMNIKRYLLAHETAK